MTHSRREHIRALCGSLAAPRLVAGVQPDFQSWPDNQKEQLLRTATIVSVQEIGHGVTKPLRASLALGCIEHAAKIQNVDKELPDFFPQDGSRPVPMKDSWRFNIAAYRVDRLLGLHMATVAVSRLFKGKPAAFSWWVDDVKFEEVDRVRLSATPPDMEAFQRQREQSRVFDELIINIDRNLSNLLITTDWKLVLIDHSRCFTPYPKIRNEANLNRCGRRLLASLRGLTRSSVQMAAGRYLTALQIDALLGRRDRIVHFFERAAKDKGEENVYFS